VTDAARAALIASLACVVVVAEAEGQSTNQDGRYLGLSGLTAVSPRVMVNWDMAVTMRGGATRSEFELDLRGAFELGLRGAGVGLDEMDPAQLECVVSLTYEESPEGTVVSSRTVRLLTPNTPGDALGAWTVSWSRGETRVTSRDALSGAEVGSDCAGAFERDWLRANGAR